MEDLIVQSLPRTDAEYQVEIDRLLVEIEAMQREMRASDERFDRTHAAILDSLSRTSRVLDRLAAK